LASNQLTTINFFDVVDDFMPQVEELLRSQAVGQHPDLESALAQLLSSGGKRIRPAVALLTGGMLGGDQQKIMTLAAAIELLHTATLVHDDFIDGADMRRGNATLNSQWSPAATVLTGDFIFARAARLASLTGSIEVMRNFADTLAVIVSGEINQLFNSRGLANREDYERRIYAKTGSMFELATTAAALLSPVSEIVVERARSFGHDVGIAFQIVDDVLDFTGQQSTVGKPVASDLRQGLITLPALYYLEEHPDDPDLQVILSGNFPNSKQMDRLVDVICESSAIERSIQDAQEYINSARTSLHQMPDNYQRRALESLADYIIDRRL
jgi:geranylgeranyl pyrophosphate synthase